MRTVLPGKMGRTWNSAGVESLLKLYLIVFKNCIFFFHIEAYKFQEVST